MVSVFVGTSLDGYIARLNGALDFLPPGGGEPHGYDEFIASVDAIVIGRKTFETVLTLGPWPYGNKRVVVLSSRPVDLSLVKDGVVEQMAGPPAEIISRLAASGAHHLYVDGGITIQQFLRAGLIQRLIITRVPVLIGDGIPLFGALPADIRLRHVATRQYASGWLAASTWSPPELRYAKGMMPRLDLVREILGEVTNEAVCGVCE
jgi:dihydrofolate reductase